MGSTASSQKPQPQRAPPPEKKIKETSLNVLKKEIELLDDRETSNIALMKDCIALLTKKMQEAESKSNATRDSATARYGDGLDKEPKPTSQQNKAPPPPKPKGVNPTQVSPNPAETTTNNDNKLDDDNGEQPQIPTESQPTESEAVAAVPVPEAPAATAAAPAQSAAPATAVSSRYTSGLTKVHNSFGNFHLQNYTPSTTMLEWVRDPSFPVKQAENFRLCDKCRSFVNRNDWKTHAEKHKDSITVAAAVGDGSEARQANGDTIQELVNDFMAQRKQTFMALQVDSHLAAAVFVYSLETEIYGTVNRAMREQLDDVILEWRAFVYYLTRALRTLPTYHGNVYRGLNCKLDRSLYSSGEYIVWRSFSSSTTSLNVVKNFLGSGDGTLFVIRTANAHPISKLSAYEEEEEYLFEPNSEFRVMGMLADGVKAIIANMLQKDLRNTDVYELDEIPTYDRNLPDWGSRFALRVLHGYNNGDHETNGYDVQTYVSLLDSGTLCSNTNFDRRLELRIDGDPTVGCNLMVIDSYENAAHSSGKGPHRWVYTQSSILGYGIGVTDDKSKATLFRVHGGPDRCTFEILKCHEGRLFDDYYKDSDLSEGMWVYTMNAYRQYGWSGSNGRRDATVFSVMPLATGIPAMPPLTDLCGKTFTLLVQRSFENNSHESYEPTSHVYVTTISSQYDASTSWLGGTDDKSAAAVFRIHGDPRTACELEVVDHGWLICEDLPTCATGISSEREQSTKWKLHGEIDFFILEMVSTFEDRAARCYENEVKDGMWAYSMGTSRNFAWSCSNRKIDATVFWGNPAAAH